MRVVTPQEKLTYEHAKPKLLNYVNEDKRQKEWLMQAKMHTRLTQEEQLVNNVVHSQLILTREVVVLMDEQRAQTMSYLAEYKQAKLT